jgi:outer membrane murein-binding lipoprotein Lpp
MTDDPTSKKVSLIERIRLITSAAILAGSLLIGGAVHATTTRPSSVVNRAVAVQDALKEKLRTDASATLDKQTPRAQTLVAEWINWGNWNNWNNYWVKWVKWVKWGNWGNWVNF